MVAIPPEVFYVLGAVLIAAGVWRAYNLGWKRRSEVNPEADAEKGLRRRNYGPKQHVAFGLLWIAMGIFVIVSTIVNLPKP